MRIKIREIRKEKGMLLQDLCAAADVSKSFLICLESGQKNNPSLHTIVRIAHALGVKVTDIVDFED